jgi:zinc protease
MKSLKIFIIFIIFVANAQSATQLQEFILANGMKIIVQEDKRTDTVVSQVWYKVGSSYEHNGITGVSHALEHMMFKGTKNLKPGEFSEIIANAGGTENAFTSKDYTAYFQKIHKDKLELCLKLEADRMRNIQLNEEEFKKEISVIKEERRMRTDDKPRSGAYEKFVATAFTTSPVRNPIIGWMNDIDNLTLQDLKSWYENYYTPNNATLVVVGNVQAQDVFLLAKKYFGNYKKRKIKQPKKRKQLKQSGKKQIHLFSKKAKLPYLQIGYKTPVIKNATKPYEPYALEVMAYILDGGSSALFNKNLIQGKQLAASISTSYNPNLRLGGLFSVSAIPSAKTNIKVLEQAIYKEIDKIKKGKISEKQIQRVRNTILANEIYARDSTFYQAMQIGIAETIGIGYKTYLAYTDRIQKVTIKEVVEVANKYFNDDKKTIAILHAD